jgi:hypothetical protein
MRQTRVEGALSKEQLQRARQPPATSALVLQRWSLSTMRKRRRRRARRRARGGKTTNPVKGRHTS